MRHKLGKVLVPYIPLAGHFFGMRVEGGGHLRLLEADFTPFTPPPVLP